MHALHRIQVSPFVLSAALVVCSAAWFVGAYSLCVTREKTIDGWSATPLIGMLPLALSPLSCLILGFMVVQSRHQCRDKLTMLDWCGLFAGCVVVVLGGFLVVGVLGSMRAMGI